MFGLKYTRMFSPVVGSGGLSKAQDEIPTNAEPWLGRNCIDAFVLLWYSC